MNEEKIQIADSKTAAKEINSDVSYGGCRYRVAYDKYEKNFVKNRAGLKISSVIIGIVLFAVFFLLGFLIIRYYNNSVDAYNQSSSVTDSKPQFTYQSFAFADE